MHPESIACQNKYWRSFCSRFTSDSHGLPVVHTGKRLSVIFFLLLLFSSIEKMTYDNSALYFASMHIYETPSVAVALVFGAIFRSGRVRTRCRTAILNTFTDGRQLFANVFNRTSLGIMFPTSPKACTAEGSANAGRKKERGKESPVNSIVRLS